LIEVDAFDLCEPLSNEPGLVFLNCAVWAPFDAKDPFTSNDFPSFGPRYDVVHVQMLPGLHLVFAGREPFGSIWARHGFVVGLWFGYLSIGDIGAVTVGRDVVAWIVVGDRRTCAALGTRGKRWKRWYRSRRRRSRKGSGSGRWHEVVSSVGFEDNSLLSVVGPPFIEYDVTRFYEPVRRSVHQTESSSLLGEAKESAG
jgi:hypothetical protein